MVKGCCMLKLSVNSVYSMYISVVESMWFECIGWEDSYLC